MNINKKILTVAVICLVCSYNLFSQNNYNSFVTQDTINVRNDTNDWSLIFYTPHNSHLCFTTTRPDTNNDKIIFSVAGAFTGQNLRDVVGNYIEQGVVKENKTDKETGFCVMYDNKVVIKPLNDSMNYYFNKAQQKKGYYFQQMMLLNDGKTVPCTIFRCQKPTFRRALAIYNGKAMVVETKNRMNVEDFAWAMQKIGIKYAIYLDMGSWSDGFLRNKDNEVISIGHLKQNTRYQSNWIEYRQL